MYLDPWGQRKICKQGGLAVEGSLHFVAEGNQGPTFRYLPGKTYPLRFS